MNDFSYKGLRKTKNYFEGWYLKVVDDKSNLTYAIIFGISLYENDPHSFIQIVSSNDDDSYYYRFSVDDFYCNRESVRIKDNVFGVHELKVKVGSFDFDLSIKPTVELKCYGLTNSAMGCIKYLPLCTYHEIIFMNAKVEGTLKTSDISKEVHGSAYMEKNWGSKFPKHWLWIQTNHFKNNNASLTLAIADIFKDKKGFFCILNVDGDEFRFATYNCFKVNFKCDEKEVKVLIDKGNISLVIKASLGKGPKFIGPIKKGQMKRDIEECLSSTLTLYLYKDGKLIFNDTATNVSVENQYEAN